MKKTRWQDQLDKIDKTLNTQKLGHFYEQFYNHHRGTGSTDMAIECCKRNSAFLLLPTEKVADEVHEVHGVTTFSPDQGSTPTMRKHIIDSAAVYRLAQQYRVLEEQVRELQRIIAEKRLYDMA